MLVRYPHIDSDKYIIKSLGNSSILLIAWILLRVLSAALCFVGVTTCVDTELNE